MSLPPARLGVNIDHVATVRKARGGVHPDPVRAALEAAAAGADGVTAHLREDRRHISDDDVARLKAQLTIPLNLEMAATEEMLAIALRTRPYAACLVPEKREERTTEGGLDAAGQHNHLAHYVRRLGEADARVSLFIEPDPAQIVAAVTLGAPVVEFHTGAYCEAAAAGDDDASARALSQLTAAAAAADAAGLEVHMGHGLTFETIAAVAVIPEIAEFNIGHFLVSEAIFISLREAVGEMRRRIDAARDEGA